jgi:hypothetical protein
MIRLVLAGLMLATLSSSLKPESPAWMSTFRKSAMFDSQRLGAGEWEAQAMQRLGASLGTAMRACVPPGAKRPSAFELALLVDAKGRAELHVAVGSQVSGCVGKRLTPGSLPPPPFAPYHFLIAMKVEL